MLPLPCRQLIIYAKRVLSAFTSHSPLLPLSLHLPLLQSLLCWRLFCLPVMSCGIAFVSLAFMTLYLCFCLSVCVSLCLFVCRCVLVCVYKLHYTTSNITNDNKHLADTTQQQQQQQKQFHKNVFFLYCCRLRLLPQVCIMLYNLLMTLLMTVIATAVGTAQTVVHSTLSPLSSPPSLRPLLLLLPFGLSLLSVRVPDIAFSACCSAPTACRGISKWQFWVFRLFDCSVYRSDSTPLPALPQ